MRFPVVGHCRSVAARIGQQLRGAVGRRSAPTRIKAPAAFSLPRCHRPRQGPRGFGSHRPPPAAKTARSRRTLPLPPTVLSALRRHQGHQATERFDADNWADPGLVFATAVGTPIHPRNDNRSFREIIRQAGLRQVRLHDLRHTAASVLLAQGVPARVVMEILGNSQISVTLNIHAHVAPEVAREAAARLEGALWSGE
ncbi:site-specific integrase [Micromonospora sp. NPDC005220]|uniref:tyrosine-type recombinase/integrase n=1 Tax=Micromonospora sp. NPDC005220 TaxID=3155589 RepID=UPI0033BA4629